MTAPVDFDLHGLAGIRLLNATADDAAVIARQLGPIQASLTRQPDITIRFVDQLPAAPAVNYLGLNDVGYTQEHFLVLRSVHKLPARVQIPMDQVGGQIEIVCERGLPALPLLIPIVNLTVLQNGALPIHASAFIYDGCGVLVTGWAKGGKTEALLAFMMQGATYIGDEWIYLDYERGRMYGIPEPIRLWAWQLADVPQYRAAVQQGDRVKLQSLAVMERTLSWNGGNPTEQSAFAKLSNRLNALLKKQQYVQVPPQRLFGPQACALEGPFDKLFFVGSAGINDVVVEPVPPEAVAQRMVFSLQEEYLDFTSTYLKFRFAFPERRNALLEELESVQRAALVQALAGKEAYQVKHAYPVHIPDLFLAMQSYIH